MMWRDVITLQAESMTINEYGDRVFNKTPVIVFANKKSIRQSEFYQAFATGLKPELMFEVRSVDYDGQPNLLFNSKEYVIIRTHSKNDEITELVCSGMVQTGGY
jgi:SPP1 family predicted phage head-tail adaptor